jgi:hypothetical protein
VNLMSRELSLGKVIEAVILAAKDNEDSHVAELEFAAKLAKHPEIMGARLGRIQYTCRVLGVKSGGVLLDVGSGIGLNSVLSLLCGVGEVHSVEMTHDRLRSARLILNILGVEDRIHLHGRDILELDLPPGTVDAAFSFELLEHISDIGTLYGKLAQWLKQGSRVFGRTGGNGRNLIYRKTFRKTWDLIDHEHYIGLREEAIRGLLPDAPAEDVKLLADRTRGELIDQVRKVADEYKRKRTVPGVKSPCAPRDPLTGQYMERLLNPYETARIMDAQGFRTSLLKPNFQNISTLNPVHSFGLKALGQVIRMSHPASLSFAPWLEFLSERESTCRVTAARRKLGAASAT